MARTLPQCGVLRLTLLFAALVVVVQVVVLVRFSSSYDDVDNSNGAIGAPNGETRPSTPLVDPRTNDRVTEKQHFFNDGRKEEESRKPERINVDSRITKEMPVNVLVPSDDVDDDEEEKEEEKEEKEDAEVSWSEPTTSPCDIEWPDAQSALNRARSDQCKTEIRRVTCLAQRNLLYDVNLKKNCPSLPTAVGAGAVQKEQQRVVDWKDLRIVYLMVVHGRAFRQFRRLFKAIYNRQHYYYIHVDSRSDYLHRKIEELAYDYSNVVLSSWRLASIWGGASLLQVLLRSIDDLIQRRDWEWDFVINLSESDYPIKTEEALMKYLAQRRGKNFLKPHGGNAMRFIKKQGLDRTFVECDNHMWRIGNRVVPPDIDVDGGSDWICLNREFSDYLINSRDHLLVGLKQMYKYSLLPAESFFHTVLRNGPMCHSFEKNNLRVTNWNRKLGCRCQYKHIVDWCGCSPNDFKPEDLGRLQSSPDRFFARKFEAVVNQEIINRLDSWLFGEMPPDTPGMDTYIESLYHVDDTLIKPPDSHMTCWLAFMRLGTSHLGQIAKQQQHGGVGGGVLGADSGSNHPHGSPCALEPVGKPIEVSVFKEKDDLRGLVVTFDVSPAGTGGRQRVKAQTWFEPIANPTTYSALRGPSARLTFLGVGYHYDEKERMFRSFGNIIGPHDDVVVACQWTQGMVITVKFTWYDPLGQVAAVQSQSVQATSVVSFYRPSLDRPLKPGVWQTVAEYEGEKLASTEFVIMPVSVHNGVEMRDMELAAKLNGIPSHVAANNDRVLRDVPDVNRWVDAVVGKHWRLQGFCLETAPPQDECGSSALSLCSSEYWSTAYPDPKSELGPIRKNGRIR